MSNWNCLQLIYTHFFSLQSPRHAEKSGRLSCFCFPATVTNVLGSDGTPTPKLVQRLHWLLLRGQKSQWTLKNGAHPDAIVSKRGI